MRRVLILEKEAFLGALLSERFKRSGFEVQLLPNTPPRAFTYAPDLIIVGSHEGASQHLYRLVPAVPVIMLGEPWQTPPKVSFPILAKPFSPNRLVALATSYLLAQKL